MLRFLPEDFSFRKVVIILVLIAVVAAGIFYCGQLFFFNSDFFTVQDVVINADYSYSYVKGMENFKGRYIGRNIFEIDLNQVKMLIENDFPQFKKVEVRRGLPDNLEIDIVMRKPVAVIESSGGLIIDEEGMVIAVRKKTKGLLRIKGITFFLRVPAVGDKVTGNIFDKILPLIQELRIEIPKIVENIEYLEVSNRNNITLGIQDVPIKLGKDDFSRKINKLREILEDPDIYLKNIKYMDLRFEDAVIAPK